MYCHSTQSCLPEVAWDPTNKGLTGSHETLSLPPFQTQVTDPGCHLCSWPTSYRLEVPVTPCLDFQVATSWIQPFQGLIAVVWSLSHVWLFATPQIATRQASPSFTIYRSVLRLMSIELMMPSNHLILCCPLLLLPSILPSIRVFSEESALRIRWSKYWSFSFSISPSNEYSGLISFRIDWFNLLAVQGTQELEALKRVTVKPKSPWAHAGAFNTCIPGLSLSLFFSLAFSFLPHKQMHIFEPLIGAMNLHTTWI